MSARSNHFPNLADVATPAQRQELWAKIKTCIETSATNYPMRGGGLTQAEVKRRVDFCVDMVTTMIRERGWTVSRTCDHIWPALESKLTSRVVVLSDRAFYPVATVG
jgi:hypothetical protein